MNTLDEALKRLNEYDWIVFTSVHGVRFFMKRMAGLNIPSSALSSSLAAIGTATASALERIVKKPELVPTEFLSWKIADGLGDVKGRRILLARADIASKKLPDLMRKLAELWLRRLWHIEPSSHPT